MVFQESRNFTTGNDSRRQKLRLKLHHVGKGLGQWLYGDRDWPGSCNYGLWWGLQFVSVDRCQKVPQRRHISFTAQKCNHLLEWELGVAWQSADVFQVRVKLQRLLLLEDNWAQGKHDCKYGHAKWWKWNSIQEKHQRVIVKDWWSAGSVFFGHSHWGRTSW